MGRPIGRSSLPPRNAGPTGPQSWGAGGVRFSYYNTSGKENKVAPQDAGKGAKSKGKGKAEATAASKGRSKAKGAPPTASAVASAVEEMMVVQPFGVSAWEEDNSGDTTEEGSPSCATSESGLPEQEERSIMDKSHSEEELEAEETLEESEEAEAARWMIQALKAGPLPSVGSAAHWTGECKRCCFFPKGRCTNAENCEFCHFDHAKRPRRKKNKMTSSATASCATSESGGLPDGESIGMSDETQNGSEKEEEREHHFEKEEKEVKEEKEESEEDEEEDEEESEEVEEARIQALKAGPLPSIGSAAHWTGECRRCCFFPKGRCTNAENCEFCHFDHEKRHRKKKKKSKAQRRLAAEIQALEERGEPGPLEAADSLAASMMPRGAVAEPPGLEGMGRSSPGSFDYEGGIFLSEPAVFVPGLSTETESAAFYPAHAQLDSTASAHAAAKEPAAAPLLPSCTAAAREAPVMMKEYPSESMSIDPVRVEVPILDGITPIPARPVPVKVTIEQVAGDVEPIPDRPVPVKLRIPHLQERISPSMAEVQFLAEILLDAGSFDFSNAAYGYAPAQQQHQKEQQLPMVHAF